MQTVMCRKQFVKLPLANVKYFSHNNLVTFFSKMWPRVEHLLRINCDDYQNHMFLRNALMKYNEIIYNH